MKKLLYRKFLTDTFKFFIIISLSIGLIVWVIQAVGFLDFVTEDGHGLLVYFSYTLFNFPKIIHRILPFVFFISLFYKIYQYEIKNELLIFWTNGIKKMDLIKAIITYSILIVLLQILLGAFISPFFQDKARSFIRNSNIDFFSSLIKEGKFIDTVSNLTIFIESKDSEGNYINIFLNDALNGSKGNRSTKSQMIYAKKGILIEDGDNKFFRLTKGRVIDNDQGEITNFSFEKLDFNLSKYDSKTTTYPKIQEASSKDLFNCIYNNFKDERENFKANYLRCNDQSIKPIKQEFLKRFYKPFYIPLLALISCLLMLKSKESADFNSFRIYLFLVVFFFIVISEMSLRYTTSGTSGLLFFILFPFFSFILILTYLRIKFNYTN
jgi:lipopolysaccharide export system permease protein